MEHTRGRFSNNIATLRQYAFRVVGQQELLEPWEDEDRAARLEDYFAVGISCDCTHMELVMVLLKDLSPPSAQAA